MWEGCFFVSCRFFFVKKIFTRTIGSKRNGKVIFSCIHKEIHIYNIFLKTNKHTHKIQNDENKKMQLAYRDAIFHQIKLAIGRHKRHDTIRVEFRQFDTLMEWDVVELNHVFLAARRARFGRLQHTTHTHTRKPYAWLLTTDNHNWALSRTVLPLCPTLLYRWCQSDTLAYPTNSIWFE